MENIYYVAEYFLSKESMSHKKLQKLCYYAQAWNLAIYNEPLVPNRFEAWVHGPVSPDLYYVYKEWGRSLIPLYTGAKKVSDFVVTFLDKIYEAYGNFTDDQLENMTHQEEPWLSARQGLSSYEYSREPISRQTMRDYYGKRIARTY